MICMYEHNIYVYTHIYKTDYVHRNTYKHDKTNKFILNLFNRIYVSAWSKKSDIRYILL